MALNRGWSYQAQVGTAPPRQTVLAHLAARYPHSSTKYVGGADRGR